MDAVMVGTDTESYWGSDFGITRIYGWASVAVLQRLHPHPTPHSRSKGEGGVADFSTLIAVNDAEEGIRGIRIWTS
jgi:hypothetical protein